MTIVRRCKPGQLEKLLKADLERLVQRVDGAIEKTAEDGVAVVQRNAPEAFGELKDGIVAVMNSIYSVAPHAAPVEVGSRPHMPPFEPILAWVRLRGLQGIEGTGKGTAPQAVAARIRATGDGTSTPVDAAERIAWAICHKIAREGTAPQWYMRNSLPEVFAILDANLRAELLGDG